MYGSRIDVNALSLRPGGSGVQTYVRELLHAMSAASAVPIVAHVQADAVGELPEQVESVTYPVASGARRAVSGLTLRTPPGLFHGLDVDLPLRHDGPLVTTVHDLSVFDVPWAHGAVRARGERLLVARAIRRADAIISDSAFTSERIAALFGRSSTIALLAAAPSLRPAGPEAVDEVRTRYAVPAHSALFVGTVEPRKQVPMLAAACRRAGVELLVAGAVPPGQQVPEGARHLGYVPAADLPALYAAADVVAYPSTYEGFGLPPLEAMACGAAVVATRVGALPDIIDDGAHLVRAGDENLLADALREAVHDTDLNAQLRTAGPQVAGRLTWAATAAATLDVYRGLGVAC